MPDNRFIHNTLLIAILLSPLFSAHLHAAAKKWVDEYGQVHYGDRIPSKYLTKEHSTINDQGIVIETTAKSKTDDELAAEAKKQKQKAAEERLRQIEARKKALRDRVLTDTFTTENDLILARDARVEAVDSQISLAETLIKNDEEKLADVKQRIKEIKDSGRDAPENLHKEVVSVSKQLENNYAFIEDRNNERKAILDTFNADIKRFRELMKEKHEAKLKEKN